MKILYNFSMYLFSAAISVAAIFSRKIKTMVKGRREVFERLKDAEFSESDRVVWVHCASLGEFEQGRSVIEAIKKEEPETKIVLTFFSPSGYEIRKNYPGADFICYLRGDTRANARRFVRMIRPDIAIFVKYEYWYNYLNELDKVGAKSYVVSAIFRPGMRFFKPSGGFFRSMLRLIDRFFVQNEESAQLLESIGLGDRVTVSGDTRFDRVADIVLNAPQFPLIKKFTRGAKVMVCGSTWLPDLELLLSLMKEHPDVKFIVAPHEIVESDIEELIRSSERVATRYTQKANDDATLMIVDCVGILSGVYSCGDFAYIGGGFGAGIHNILEAATWGLPVIFGRNYHKFAEAEELIDRGGAFSVENYGQLRDVFDLIVRDREKISEIAKDYVASNIGATGVILREILR